MRVLPVALAVLVAASGCARAGGGSAARRVAEAVAAHNPASANDGGRIYTTNCASCHQADGRGVPGAFPPLAGNPFVTGAPEPVVAVVKLGMRGKQSIDGQRYDGTMPRWGQMISDEDIAAVVTYIRVSWHNRASAVSVSDVRAVSP